MQQKFLVWCINLNIAELLLKFALILRVSESFWGAYAFNVFNRSPKFGQNMRQVVLNRNKVSNICYNHNHVNHGNMTDSKLPYSQSSFFSELRTCGHIMPFASPSVLIWVITSSHIFAMRSVRGTYIVWPSTPYRGIYSHNYYFTPEWYWCIHGYSLSLTHIFNKYRIAATQQCVSLFHFWSTLHGLKYDSMILGSQSFHDFKCIYKV